MITVRQQDAQTWEVIVAGPPATRHEVVVTPEVHASLTNARVTAEALLERSFRFLLEREPNTSILRRFELPVIARYFPEYEDEIRAWAQGEGD